MSELLNISSGPHIRNPLSTKAVMHDVLIALLPTTVLGIWAHGAYSAMIIAVSIATAVLTEYLFDKVTKRKNTVADCSAIVTGLLLALTLPARVPVYIPVLGAVFAILVVKCLFGGLGHNIMNPALAGRSFLLISFGTAMTGYTLDSVAGATPLAQVAAGQTVDLLALCIGNTSGVIGSSALGLLAGGIYLLLSGGITWEIPTSIIVSFTAFVAIFGGHGLSAAYILPQILGGGLLMAAFFMATDPVSSPSTTKGQLIFGAFTGILIGLFRVKGASADSTTYAVLLA
ncbi:MAG: RnfABCDGE type electron transport complex subunit D, partial [Clostridia bacterium]|nr:RnfABCDGE type electron transport complex subunit D [Clostridia bacterium]